MHPLGLLKTSVVDSVTSGAQQALDLQDANTTDVIAINLPPELHLWFSGVVLLLFTLSSFLTRFLDEF